MSTYKLTATLLGIKITERSPERRWDLVCPASPIPSAFTEGPATYCFETEAEVEAFVTGYSLVVYAFLDGLHTPRC